MKELKVIWIKVKWLSVPESVEICREFVWSVVTPHPTSSIPGMRPPSMPGWRPSTLAMCPGLRTRYVLATSPRRTTFWERGEIPPQERGPVCQGARWNFYFQIRHFCTIFQCSKLNWLEMAPTNWYRISIDDWEKSCNYAWKKEELCIKRSKYPPF